MIVSCSDEIRTKEQIYKTVKKHDPKAKIILPKSMDEGIKCTDYGPGCLAGHTVQVMGLEMIFVEFEKMEQARKVAVAIDAYYIFNWVLDDVIGEPILEKFVKDVFKAVNAREELKAKKKKESSQLSSEIKNTGIAGSFD